MRIPIPDVVVLLPGITGSALAKDGKEIWAPSAGAVLRNLIGLGAALKKGLVVEDDDWKADDLGDGITPTRLMPDVHLLPGLWKIDGYGAIERFLLETFALEKGRNYFPFPYDWRRDNRANARRLERQSRAWLREWRASSGREDAQLVLIGHSMGGLVARYFIEALGGWQVTRALVSFGSPFYGSLNALGFLVEGFEKKVGPLGIDLSQALRSMRSVHQLVPSYKCVYVDAVATTPAKAQIPGWKAEWDTALTDFTDEVERAAAANREDEQFLRDPVVYRPIVGTDQPTRQSAVVTADKVEIVWDRGGSNEGGDGTVPLLSAALSGTEAQRTFAPQQHARLQNYESMLAHLKGVLTSMYHVRVEDLRTAATSWFAFRAEDIYPPGAPVVVEIGACSALDESLLPVVQARLVLVHRDTGETCVDRSVTVPRELTAFEIDEPLAAGVYTLEVSALFGEAVAPLSDVLVVAGDELTG